MLKKSAHITWADFLVWRLMNDIIYPEPSRRRTSLLPSESLRLMITQTW